MEKSNGTKILLNGPSLCLQIKSYNIKLDLCFPVLAPLLKAVNLGFSAATLPPHHACKTKRTNKL